MRSFSLSNVLAALLMAQFGVSFDQVDYSQYVNPFMGGLGPFEGLACKLSQSFLSRPTL